MPGHIKAEGGTVLARPTGGVLATDCAVAGETLRLRHCQTNALHEWLYADPADYNAAQVVLYYGHCWKLQWGDMPADPEGIPTGLATYGSCQDCLDQNDSVKVTIRISTFSDPQWGAGGIVFKASFISRQCKLYRRGIPNELEQSDCGTWMDNYPVWGYGGSVGIDGQGTGWTCGACNSAGHDTPDRFDFHVDSPVALCAGCIDTTDWDRYPRSVQVQEIQANPNLPLPVEQSESCRWSHVDDPPVMAVQIKYWHNYDCSGESAGTMWLPLFVDIQIDPAPEGQ